jgi:GTP-binding protein
MAQQLKHVVIVGRPNVGKSTLFNRIAGKRRALIHDLPGMTRDRLTDVVELDSGRRFELTDTGGLEYGDTPMSAYADEIKAQARRAVESADLILFVLDGSAGILPEDRDIANDLRRDAARTIVIVNKVDRRDAEEAVNEFYELGFERLLPLSAEHGTGLDDLLDAIAEILPAESAVPDEEADADAPIRVAIIGRPNVGKSSLLNRLTNEERAVVSPISGTTRDAIDSEIVRNGRRYLLIDTAGIRRKGKTTDEAEKLAVVSARKAIERCEIALVMFDANDGPTAQDAHVAGYAEEAGRAAMILVNKWDVGEHAQDDAKKFEDMVRFKLKFLPYAPLEFISAKTGRRVEKVFPRIDEIMAGYRKRFRTSELNTRHRWPPASRTPRPSSALLLRHAVEGGPSDFRALLEHGRAVALLLSPLSREPVPRGTRAHWLPDSPRAARPEGDEEVVLSRDAPNTIPVSTSVGWGLKRHCINASVMLLA